MGYLYWVLHRMSNGTAWAVGTTAPAQPSPPSVRRARTTPRWVRPRSKTAAGLASSAATAWRARSPSPPATPAPTTTGPAATTRAAAPPAPRATSAPAPPPPHLALQVSAPKTGSLDPSLDSRHGSAMTLCTSRHLQGHHRRRQRRRLLRVPRRHVLRQRQLGWRTVPPRHLPRHQERPGRGRLRHLHRRLLSDPRHHRPHRLPHLHRRHPGRHKQARLPLPGICGLSDASPWIGHR